MDISVRTMDSDQQKTVNATYVSIRL